MAWNDDEDLYQPRIHSRWIRHLHRISAETGEPMTVLLDHALAEFVEQYGVGPDTDGIRRSYSSNQRTKVHDETLCGCDVHSESSQDS